MAIAKTSLSGVVKEIEQVTKALRALKVGATPPERKLLDAKIKKLGTLKAQTAAVCARAKTTHPTLNANPLLQAPSKSKR
ncbi:MAG TPA: hypothetical protein VN830_00420 [Verrucomicrobiae bacterium]|nr:hypothetical protein [Verrucomicrobiae bacterium]